MADRITYLNYKQDQKLLIYWITSACNDIINTTSPSEAPVVPVPTGEVSLATLKKLSELIARHNKRIPAIIYQLFWSIIEARRKTHLLFMEIAASNPDPNIQRNNDTHSHWINGLTDAFNILGGDSWLLRKSTKSDPPDEDKQEAIFTNKFFLLSLDDQSTFDDDEDEKQDNAEQFPVTNRATQVREKSVNKKKRRRRRCKPKT